MSLELVKGKLANLVLKECLVNERIQNERETLSLALRDAITNAGDDLRSWVLHLATGLIVMAEKSQVDNGLRACRDTGMPEEDARIFVVNAALSELLTNKAINPGLRKEVKTRLGLG